MAIARKEGITSDFMRDGLNPLKENRPDVKVKTKKRMFVSLHGKQGFKMPVRGEDGKIIYKTSPVTGMPVLINGRKIPALRDINFITQSNNVKLGCLSYFETDDPEEIEVLDKLAADPTTKIMTEDEYQKTRSPDIYKIQKELKEKNSLIAELEEERTMDKDIIEELNKKIEELSKKGK